jgi:hypothetical protein
MTDEVEVLEPAVEAPEALTPSTDALVEEQDYDTEFNAAVAKREAEKSGNEVPQPDREPDAEEPAPVEKEPAKAPAKVEPNYDWLASIPEAQRDAVKSRLDAASAAEAKAAKLELDNRSMAGRMSAYQRKYEEAAGKRPVEVAAKAAVEQSAEWTQFQEDYPDIAKAIESRHASSLNETKSLVEFVENEKRQRFLTDAWEAVETIHPGWRKTGSTPEFKEWRASSSTYEKLASSDDVADAVALFDLYRAHQSSTAAPKIDPAAQASANALAARRGAQAEGARAPTQRASSPNDNVDLTDPDQLFAFYAKKSNNRMKARNS